MSNKQFAFTLAALMLVVIALAACCIVLGFQLGSMRHEQVFNKDSYPQINYAPTR
jgi:hypothetical protein